jgi:hypothetical protein
MTFIREAPFNEEDHPTLKEDYGFILNFFKSQTARPDLIDAEVQLVEARLVASRRNTSSWSVPPPT